MFADLPETSTNTTYSLELQTGNSVSRMDVGAFSVQYTTICQTWVSTTTEILTYNSKWSVRQNGRKFMEIGSNLSKDTAGVICELPMKLPSLNEYVNVCRTNPYKASKFKKDLERDIGIFIEQLPRFENPVEIHFHWIEGNKKRDLDNVAFAKKFILDAMVKYGKLKDDNRRCVTAFQDSFWYAEETKVILVIKEVSDGI